MTLTQIELILLTWCFFLSAFQQAAFHPEVSEELRSKALQYSSECTTGYISLLEQVLQVRAGQAGAFLSMKKSRRILSFSALTLYHD